MSNRIKPYLQLVRLPNIFTAAADPIAGLLLVGASLKGSLLVVPASMAIYAAGIVYNDICDRDIDLRERPDRPIPSGRVSESQATVLAAAMFIIGCTCALLTFSRNTIVVFAVLSASVFLYDRVLKRTVFGPQAMGLCRGLNLLLGMSQSQSLGGPVGWSACLAYGLFVCGVTWISRSETLAGKSKGVLAGTLIQNLAFLVLFLVSMSGRRFPNPWLEGPIVPILGLAVLAGVAMLVNLYDGEAIREPVPNKIQTAVKTAILSLVWIDVALVAAVRGPVAAVPVALLWIPAFLLGKWLYST